MPHHLAVRFLVVLVADNGVAGLHLTVTDICVCFVVGRVQFVILVAFK